MATAISRCQLLHVVSRLQAWWAFFLRQPSARNIFSAVREGRQARLSPLPPWVSTDRPIASHRELKG